MTDVFVVTDRQTDRQTQTLIICRETEMLNAAENDQTIAQLLQPPTQPPHPPGTDASEPATDSEQDNVHVDKERTDDTRKQVLHRSPTSL